jgi:MFS family permease
MDEANLKIFKRYASHTFLQWFTQSLLVTFGALFIYAKTESIGIALAGAFFEIIGDLIIRGPLVDWWWNKLLGRRLTLAMAVGMVITALTSLGIFIINPAGSIGIALLLILCMVSSFGTSIYLIPSNAVSFRVVGHSKFPGHYASIITILRITAAALAALISLVVNAQNNFLILLPFIAIMALLSLIPLSGLRLPLEEPVKWRRAIKRVSVRTLWANFSGDGRLRSTGIPLILVLLYGSLSKSVSIGAITLLSAAVLGYFAGKLKDKSKSSIFLIALIGLVFVWIAYAVIKAPIIFIILGALEYIFSTVLAIGRDARLSRQAVNSGHVVESAIAIELTRALGTMTGMLILIIAYWATGTLPQFILVTAILFVIPKGLYALGVLDNLQTFPESNSPKLNS